jgi:hypothetical protein
MSVFKDNPGVFLPIPTGFDLQKDTLERYITSSLVHSVSRSLFFFFNENPGGIPWTWTDFLLL